MSADRGSTMIEALVGLAILGMVLAGVLPLFFQLIHTNTLSERRSNAVAAAQQVMEVLRRTPPASIPNSGSSAVQTIDAGHYQYEVQTHYCLANEYCDADTRHIVLEVGYGGEIVYTVESVYTRLR